MSGLKKVPVKSGMSTIDEELLTALQRQDAP